MRELLQPFVGCRLCWQITLAVFALILAVEAVILFPSARRFAADERQRIADHAQILVEPLLANAQAIGERSPSLEPVLGRYGVVGVLAFRARGDKGRFGRRRARRARRCCGDECGAAA